MRELTLLNFNEMKYGIWRDEFHSIENVAAIHWFSPDPGYIAGMSSVNGRTVTLFDLSACLGFPPLSRRRADYVAILLPYKEKYAGFLVDFVIEGFSISEKQFLSMPAYLRTPVVDSCVGHNSELNEILSVINISRLFEMVLKTDFKPPAVAFQISEIQQTTTEMKAVRVFTSGGKTFAIPASSAEIVSQTPEVISKMDFLPPFIKGVTLYNEEIIPLIHLARCMKMPEGSDGQMLVSDISGHKFGLLVDSDQGQIETANLTVRSLPPMAKSDWLEKAIINSEEVIPQIIPQIIPLIDPSALLAAGSDTLEKVSFQDEYHPDSDFDELYRKSEVGIQEFSLFGINHAIPQAEVEDTLKLIPYRPIPGGIPMLAGIAEYHGDLLPVLDLGVCFGGQSVVTQKWQMILLRNGNFRALILVENILSERLLPLTMQHQLPFGDPLSLVYGCYPDEFEVRLILNIAAIAVNFEKTSFKKFFNVFSVDDQTKPEDPEYFAASETHEETHEEIRPDVEPGELITKDPDAVITPPNVPPEPDVSEKTDISEKTDVSAPEPFDAPDVPEAVISDNNQSVDETTDSHPGVSKKEDIEPGAMEDIQLTSGPNILEENFEDDNDADPGIDPHIIPMDPDDEVLFDKLSSSFDDHDNGKVFDISNRDTGLFEKLNKAFDSSTDQVSEPASEDFQEVITEILDNDESESEKETDTLFLLEPEMEIMPDDSVLSLSEEDQIEPGDLFETIEPDAEPEFVESDDVIETIESDAPDELIQHFITDEGSEIPEQADDLEDFESEASPECETPIIDPMPDEVIAEIEPAADTKDFTEQDESDIMFELPEESPEPVEPEGLVDDLVEFADSMGEDNVEFEEMDSMLESEPELESQETSDTLESIDVASELTAAVVEKTDEESETRELAEDIDESKSEALPEFKAPVIDPMPEKQFAGPELAGDIKDFIEQDKSEFQEEAGEDLDNETEMENPFPDYDFLKTHNEKKSKKRKKLAVFSALLISVLFILFYYFGRSDDPVPIREELKIPSRSASVQVSPVQEPETPMVHENHQEVPPASEASAVKEKISAGQGSIANNQYLTVKPSKTVDQEQSSEASQSLLPTERNNTPAVEVSLQDDLSAVTPALSSKSPVFNKAQTAEQNITIYTVKKGDNLWTISKQYTGYGINYHSIAEKNIIINPDLIFPEQKIEIKKEQR